MAADGDTISAQNSRGFINRPTAPVSQYFGDFYFVAPGDSPRARRETAVPNDQLKELLSVVERVTIDRPPGSNQPEGSSKVGDQLYLACRASLPPTAHLVNSDDPAQLLDDMCQQPWSKAWPPVFECIERFALVSGIGGGVVNDLQAWVAACATLVKPPIKTADIALLRRGLRAEAAKLAEAETLSWLQVYLEPDTLNRTTERKVPVFRVELVLRSQRTNGPLVLESEESRTLEQIPALLDRVFARAETVALVPEIRRLVIEIVAPSDILLYGFERWERSTGYRYGTRFPVVVRLRDRLMIPNPTDQKFADDYWHAKWIAFLNSVGLKGVEALKWWSREKLDALELQQDEESVCVGLSSPLMPEQREVFDTLRDAGIPIAILMRGCEPAVIPPADWPQKMAALIQGKLCELQEAIKQIRVGARSSPDHFCNALTLLWDDPDRPPLKYDAQGVFV